jgi:hypothetical protein
METAGSSESNKESTQRPKEGVVFVSFMNIGD